MNDLLTVAEMAEELKVTTRTIRNYLAEGKLNGVKVGGQWRFQKSELYDFLGETSEHPVYAFLEEQGHSENFLGLLVLNIPIITIEKIDILKDKMLNQYNQVYDGKERKFFYQVISTKKAQVTIQGPNEYLLSFGNWLFEEIETYKNK